MRLLLFLLGALAAVSAGDTKGSSEATSSPQATDGDKDKRQTQDELVVAAPQQYLYRAPARRQYERVAAVHEPQQESAEESSRVPVRQDYRPGQVYSVDARELLELQDERKAQYLDQQSLQHIYQEPQVALQPSHTVIVRPPSSANGGEVSVGAALSVSDTGVDTAALDFDRELLALLGHAPLRQATPTATHESAVPVQYTRYQPEFKPLSPSQERHATVASTPKPVKSKKPRTKTSTPAPVVQYLIETTNPQTARPAQLRPAQNLRYVAAQPVYYDRPESQALNIVTAPKLEQRPAYRYLSQPQAEAAEKQYRVIQEAPQPKAYRVVAEAPKAAQEPKQQVRYVYSPSVERPTTYLKRYQQVNPEDTGPVDRYINVPAQLIGDQYYIRPVYRPSNDQRSRYEQAHLALGSTDATRTIESPAPAQVQPSPPQYVPQYPTQQYRSHQPVQYKTQPQTQYKTKTQYKTQTHTQYQTQAQPQYQTQAQPQYQTPTGTKYYQQVRPAHSAIYISKNTAPKKTPATPRPIPAVSIENPNDSLEEQRARLPPPKNNKAYTPEEFAALVAAGYSVTPIPVQEVAQSRSELEAVTIPRRTQYGQRTPQYLPFRGDDAP